MDSGQRIDKEGVRETDAMIAVGKLFQRTLHLEERLRGNDLPSERYLERLYGRVNLAAKYLRDWGFNAKADEMLSVWGDFYGEWTQPTADVSAFLRLPGLAGNFNRWLRETLERLLKVDDQPPAAGFNPGYRLPLRLAACRDHLFLSWYEAEGKTHRSHAAIRDKWNALDLAEREEYSPQSPKKIGDGEKGRQVVITAVKKARRERKDAKRRVA